MIEEVNPIQEKVLSQESFPLAMELKESMAVGKSIGLFENPVFNRIALALFASVLGANSWNSRESKMTAETLAVGNDVLSNQVLNLSEDLEDLEVQLIEMAKQIQAQRSEQQFNADRIINQIDDHWAPRDLEIEEFLFPEVSPVVLTPPEPVPVPAPVVKEPKSKWNPLNWF
jgi:hypothetical protein